MADDRRKVTISRETATMAMGTMEVLITLSEGSSEEEKQQYRSYIKELEQAIHETDSSE